MALATSYNVAGNREDLTDILTILEPEESPLTSLAKKTTASGTFHEWQVDDLDTISFDGVNEGEDVSSWTNKAVNRTRLGNYVQKFRRTFMTSDIQQLVNTAGVPSEYAYAESKAVRELKRDLESAIASAQERQAEAGSGTPYKTRGLAQWLANGGSVAGAASSDVPAAFQCTASDTNAAPTETQFNAVLESLYKANGLPSGQMTLIAGPTLKRNVSKFTRADTSSNDSTYTVTQAAESKKVTLSVNLYDGDFGMVSIVPSIFNARTSGSSSTTTAESFGYLVDPDKIGLFVLKAQGVNELEDQGGGRRGYCDVIAGLACHNPKAHGYFEG